MQIEIKNRWSGKVQFTAEIECEADATAGVKKMGLAVRWAYGSGADLSGAVLRGADLSGADLSGAVLSDADLRGADLSGAVLRGADLSGAVLSDAVLSDADLRDADLRGAVLCGAVLRDAPKIENIHQTVYAAASAEKALDMSDWHSPCGTSHCRAGWVVTLAGEAGKTLEDRIGTRAAASLIYLASDPKLERFPDFYCDNASALADMKERAEKEAVGGEITP